MIRKQFDKEIQQILDHRTLGMSQKNRRTEYLIHWKSTEKADATWEKAVTLWQFEDQVKEYHNTPSTRTLDSFGRDGLLDP